MNIYQEAITSVENGTKFHVNLQNRSLKLGNKYIIKNGEYNGDLGVQPCSTDECLSNIEQLYRRYKYSVPSERSVSERKNYFKALMEHELDNDDFMFGERRETAKIKLELYLLCQILNGFKWDQSFGKWFWQSKNEKDLVILKEWVEPNV